MNLTLDAEALYLELKGMVRPVLSEHTHLVGITSGGAWLAQRLHQELQRGPALGIISSAMHRDDFSTRGLNATAQTQLPFDVNGADILLLDDVLFTGRTLRAVINELFDYGRPSRIRLAVLVDRGGRELPVQADVAASRVALPAHQTLALAQDAQGRFSFQVENV